MERNYFRLICLLSDLAPRVLREFLKDQWQRVGCSSLIDLLNLEKHRFYHCLHPGSQYPHDKCCCRSNKESYKSMNAAQWNLLYEYIGSTATCSYTGKHPCKYRAKARVKPEDLDISLLRLVIDKIFPGNTALDNIRKLRNELIHSGTISVSEVEFGRLWISARSNILQIANTSAAPFQADIKREIDELETRSLDSSECERLLQFVKHLRENDNLLQDISSEVAVVKQKAESTETKIEVMNTDIRSINTNVESMKTNVKATKTNVESMATNVEATKANVEFTKTNVEEMKTKVESTETKVEAIDQKIDAISKSSRHSDIQRRIENTECVLTSHRKAFYVSLGAAEEKAYSRLQEKHLVTLSGRAGSGKTSLGKQLLIKYCDQHREADGSPTYTPVIISKPDDFDHISSKDRLLVFIDDPFGASNVDNKVLKEWEKHFDNLLSYCTEGNIRIIIGVRSYMISEPEETFRKFDLFSKENIIDLSSQDKLTSKERFQLLKAYCKEYKVQIIDEEKETGRISKESSSGPNKMKDTSISSLNCIRMCVLSQISKLDTFEGFPLACFRFFECQPLFDQGAYFFKHPGESLKRDISQFEKREPILFLTLSFMLLEGGIIDPDNIDEDKLRKVNERLGFEKVNEGLGTVVVEDCCKCEISKVYIEREQILFDGNRKIEYNFTHQTVMEAVLLSLGDRYPELVLQLSHYNIIAEFVRPSGYIPNKGELCVNVPSRYHRHLADRVISNGCSSISSYRGIHDASFVEDLLGAMETTEALYEYRGKGQKSLKQAITELLTDICIFQSPLLKAVFTRYTHNGRNRFTTEKKKSKQPLIGLDKFLFALNYLLEKGFSFKDELTISFELDPVCVYTYRDGDDRECTMVPICYATETKMKHLIFFWVKMTDTVKGGYLLKNDFLYQLLDMCCKWDWVDIFKILIQNNKHNKDYQVLSPSSIYSNTTGFGRQMVQYFLQINIDVTLTDKSGNTLLHYCSRYGLSTEVLIILKTHQDIVNVRNKEGETAIIMAAKHRETNTVNAMLQHKENNIDITLTDNDGNTLLHHCCRFGLKTEVLMVLESHPEIVNVRNKYGETAIIIAAKHKEIDILNEMLQHRGSNIDITLTDNDGNSLLHHCLNYGFITEVLMILKTHPEIVNVQNKHGQTAILLVLSRKTDIIKELLQHGKSNINITLPDNDGNTLLHHCCRFGLKTEVLMILERHSKIVNLQNEDGETAIMMAVKHREKKIVNEMLQHKGINIDVTLTDKIGNTVLHLCSRYGLTTESSMILEIHPGIINFQNKDGETAIMMATMYWKTDIVETLLKHSTIDFTLTNNDGNNLLHFCSIYGLQAEVLMILETHPEIVNVQNKDGVTAIMMAAIHRKENTLNELLRHRESNIDTTLSDNGGNTLLHHCCRFGLKKEVLMILETHPEIVNVQNKDGETAIMMASNSWKTDIVKELVQYRESNIDIALTDKDGNTLLHNFCRFGFKEEVLMLLEAHPEIVNVQNKFGRTAIVVAAINKEEETLSEMLQHRESNIDIALTDKNGNTVLHYCCRYGLKREVSMILETHPEIVNIQNKNGETAIIMAAKHGEENTVNEMLRHRESIIDVAITDKDDNTLLHHCCRFGLKIEVLMILETHPEKVNSLNENGETAIFLAAMSRKTDILQVLLQHRESNIDITIADNDGNTLLHQCCRYGLKTEASLLLETHPEIVNIQNKNGETALIMAAVSWETAIVQGLIQHRESNIDIALTDKNGNTVLHYCCRYGLKKEVLMILDTHPGIVNIQNKDGETAIIMAAKLGVKNTVNEMLRHRESFIDVTLADKDNNTVLHHCCRFGLKIEVLMILETHPEIVNSRNNNGETAIFLAAMSRKTDIVQVLLQHREDNIDLGIPHNDNETLLHYCCRFGLETEAFIMLETHPGIINVQNKFGRTAIIVAAINKEEETLSKMLQHRESNIDIALTDKNGNTLLHYCCRFGLKREALMILETHPGIINVQNKNGKTAIIIAAVYKKTDIIQEMLKHMESNIDITLTDNDGNNLLHHCSKNGLKTEVLLILKTYPELLNIQNKGGNTAMPCNKV